jgi:Cellulose biosynthesis protein BcsS
MRFRAAFQKFPTAMLLLASNTVSQMNGLVLYAAGQCIATHAKCHVERRMTPAALSRMILLAFVTSVATAHAYAGPAADEAEKPSRVELYNEFEVTSIRDFYNYSALTWAPMGFLDVSGLRFRLAGDVGRYRYLNPAEPPPETINDRTFGGEFLVGYEYLISDNLTISSYVGYNIQRHLLSFPDPENSTSGTKSGFMGVLEFYGNPTDKLKMSGYASYSTANNTYFVRVRAGVGIAQDDVNFGPELTFSGDDQYKQWRLGLHLGGVQIGPVELGVSAGYLKDHSEGSGVYGLLGTSVRF